MAQPAWAPANDTEVAMAAAVERGDSQAYFRALAGATLFLPAIDEPGPQQLVTVRSGDDTYLIVFTSGDALAARLRGVTAFRTTTCDELAGSWPHPDWLLAVDPDTPIQAYAPIDVITDGAAGRIVLPPTSVWPANELEEQIDQAVRANDVHAIIKALALGVVYAPASGDATVTVFTSADQARAALPAGTPAPPKPFLDVVLEWPGAGRRLLVNPGSDAALEFDSTQVAGFVEWAREFAAGGEPAPPHPVLAPSDQLAAIVPADQLDGYLSGGRSDVSGAVYRAGDLGVFTPDVATHVIRWAAHCPDLYEPDLPGPQPAWRTHAARLPHGARLQRVDPGGRTTWLATFDADITQWVAMHDAEAIRQALMT